VHREVDEGNKKVHLGLCSPHNATLLGEEHLRCNKKRKQSSRILNPKDTRGSQSK
jgi:hypothetical protein